MAVGQEFISRISSGEDPVVVIQDLLDDEGDENFIDSLQCLCEIGGSPDEDAEPEYSVKSAQVSDSSVSVSCDVFFDEKVFGGGCPDMPTIEPRSGTVKYVIDLASGEMHSIGRDCPDPQ